MDLRATTRLILTPQLGIQILDTDFQGPLPPDTVGLLFGRSSATLKGLIVHPGVIDPDYKGIVKVLVSAPRGVIAIAPGDRIAQLLLLPSFHSQFPSASVSRDDKGFGSSGVDIVALAFDLGERPLLKLTVEGKEITGLLDTGADRTVIATSDWSPAWPTQAASQSLRGLGYAHTPEQSARPLNWKDSEGHKGQMVPYTLSLPITLWGRDILPDMGLRLSNENFSPVVQNMMLQQGYHPSFGLGRNLQGRKEPLRAVPKLSRQGLGF